MATAFPPIGSEQLDSFRHSDEHALEEIFRVEFAALTEMAATESGEPASAARIVEAAFADAWRSRERFETPQALEEFLRGDVHARSVRERSRRAAVQRFHQYEGVDAAHQAPSHSPAPSPTVEDAWSHLSAALHAPPADASRAVKESIDATRHDTAVHAAELGKHRSWVLTGALVALAAAVLVAAGVMIDRASRDASVDQALQNSETRTLSTRMGQRATLTLFDGSTAELGGDTRLMVPPGFGESVRGLRLDGTAAFTVAQNPKLPFIVLAKNARITATGTSFAISAYAEEPGVIVRVRDGEVRVVSGDNSQMLAAGGALAIHKDGRLAAPDPVALEQSLGWTDGRFAAVDKPLREVLPLLSRWYAMPILAPDSALLTRKATIRAPLDAPVEARTMMEQTAGVVVKNRNNQMVLEAPDTTKTAPAKAPAKRSRGR